MFLGWTSPMIPKLMAEHSSFRMTRDEAAWMVSLLRLGMAFGSVSSIFILHFVGRKIAILLAIIPTICSWLLTIWDTSVLTLYVSRFVGGTASGVIFTAGSIYVMEIAPPQARGALGSFFVLMDYCGNLLGYVVGSFSTMQEYSYVAMSLAVLQFLIFMWFPESPYYLLRRKDYRAAMDSLMFLRGTVDIREEMDAIMRSVECEPRGKGVVSSNLDLLFRSDGKKAILLGICVMTMQAFSGSIILFAYAQTIFERIHDVPMKESHMSIGLATVHLLSYLVCIGQVDRVGRRPLMIVSTVGVIACSFLLGVYFCMQENDLDVASFQWVSFVALMFYMISISLGMASVPYVVMNEIFPMYAKATCVSICFYFNFLWSFVMVRVWSYVAFEHSMFAAFWLVSGLNAFGILFVVFHLPETKNESFLRIQEKLVSRIKK